MLKEHSLSVSKEETTREERPKMKINLPGITGIGEIKKVFGEIKFLFKKYGQLAQENQNLRDENLKKNELIDILISKLFDKSNVLNIFNRCIEE